MKLIPKALARWLFKAGGGSVSSFQATDSAMVAAAFGNTSHSGKSVTDETMTTISAVWCCQRILSETIGAIPWAIYESDGKGNAEKADHYLSEVLVASPNADMTSVEFREAMVLGLSQRGNAYSFIDRTSSGRVTSLYPVPSANVRVKRKSGGNTKLSIADNDVFYQVLERGKWEDQPREKIWHVKGFGHGIEGLSPLAAAREAMGFALATQEFGSRFFSQGAKPSASVTIPNWLEPEQRAQAEAKLQATMTGLANMHSVALFEGGMKPDPWGENSLEDLMFVSLLGFSVLEICRFYRVPPHMVADLSRATFSNIEHMSQEFVMFTLMPYFTRFEASAAKWLFTPRDRSRFFLRFNFEGLLRADSKGRSEFYTSALQNGWMSRNEVRAKENLNRSDDQGMNDFTVQLNLAPIDKLGEVVPENNKEPMPVDSGDKSTHVSVTLPDSMTHDIKHDVEVSGVKELAAEVVRSQTESGKSIDKLAEYTGRGFELLGDRIEKLAKEVAQVSGPRKVVMNKLGEPIGTVPAERSELH